MHIKKGHKKVLTVSVLGKIMLLHAKALSSTCLHVTDNGNHFIAQNEVGSLEPTSFRSNKHFVLLKLDVIAECLASMSIIASKT